MFPLVKYGFCSPNSSSPLPGPTARLFSQLPLQLWVAVWLNSDKAMRVAMIASLPGPWFLSSTLIPPAGCRGIWDTQEKRRPILKETWVPEWPWAFGLHVSEKKNKQTKHTTVGLWVLWFICNSSWKWQSAPVFLPEKFRGWGSWWATVHGAAKDSDTT